MHNFQMALCALQSMPKAWEDPVSDIFDTLQPSSIPNVSPEGLASILLAIMTVLPEEFQTMHMAQGRKGEVRHKLQESSSKGTHSREVFQANF
jgi:Exportin 1-like protein